MIEAGLDVAGEYAFDVFENLPTVGEVQQVDLMALSRFAKRNASASALQLELAVLAHGHFSTELGGQFGPTPARDYSPWSGMIRSWSIDFIQKLQANCSPSTLSMLGI